jgi:hypothetical protein
MTSTFSQTAVPTNNSASLHTLTVSREARNDVHSPAVSILLGSGSPCPVAALDDDDDDDCRSTSILFHGCSSVPFGRTALRCFPRRGQASERRCQGHGQECSRGGSRCVLPFPRIPTACRSVVRPFSRKDLTEVVNDAQASLEL